MKRAVVALGLVVAVCSCGPRAKLERALHRAPAGQGDGSWSECVPSGIGQALESAQPLDDDKAIQIAYQIASILIGHDNSLGLDPVFDARQPAPAMAYDAYNIPHAATNRVGNRAAHVALSSRSRDLPWGISINFCDGTLWRVVCNPPIVTNEGPTAGFRPSGFWRARHRLLGTNDAVRAAVEIHSILAGIMPTKPTVQFDRTLRLWTVTLSGCQFPTMTKIVLSDHGDFLLFEREVTE